MAPRAIPCLIEKAMAAPIRPIPLPAARFQLAIGAISRVISFLENRPSLAERVFNSPLLGGRNSPDPVALPNLRASIDLKAISAHLPPIRKDPHAPPPKAVPDIPMSDRVADRASSSSSSSPRDLDRPH